jgi:hypothetical protein
MLMADSATGAAAGHKLSISHVDHSVSSRVHVRSRSESIIEHELLWGAFLASWHPKRVSGFAVAFALPALAEMQHRAYVWWVSAHHVPW